MITGTYKTKDTTVTATFCSDLSSNPPVSCVRVASGFSDILAFSTCSMRDGIFNKMFTHVEADIYKTSSIEVQIQQFPTDIAILLNGAEIKVPKLSCIVYTDIDSLEGFVCDQQFIVNTFEKIDVDEEKTEELSDSNIDTNDQEANDETEETNVSPSTIARTVALFVVSIMSIFKAFGLTDRADVDSDTIYGLVLSILNVVIAIRCWWKNNSFTNAAIKADEYMTKIKDNNDSAQG